MDSNNTNGTGWKVATGILAVLVLILLGMMWSSWNRNQHDLENVLEKGRDNIITMRAEVAMNCEGAKANEVKCEKSLSDLEDLLREFSKDIEQASSTVPTAQ